jgi:hypothetical protein
MQETYGDARRRGKIGSGAPPAAEPRSTNGSRRIHIYSGVQVCFCDPKSP